MIPIVRNPDEAAVRQLLETASLPTGDLSGPHQVEFLALGSAADPDGVVGLERFGSAATTAPGMVPSDRVTDLVACVER